MKKSKVEMSEMDWLIFSAKKGEDCVRGINHPFIKSSNNNLPLVCAACGEIHLGNDRISDISKISNEGTEYEE